MDGLGREREDGRERGTLYQIFTTFSIFIPRLVVQPILVENEIKDGGGREIERGLGRARDRERMGEGERPIKYC